MNSFSSWDLINFWDLLNEGQNVTFICKDNNGVCGLQIFG